MSSQWGFLWGAPWGSATEWGAREDDLDPTSDLIALRPADLDTVETALARLRRQFSGTATWRALATAIGTAFGEIEQAVGQLELRRYVGHADGVWLDQIGAMLGLPRGAWSSDADYRLALVAEALSQVTAGTGPEIVDVALRLVPDEIVATYLERYPANFEVTVPDIATDRFLLMLAVMADMPPAGVGALLTTWDTDLTAGWDYDPDPLATVGSWTYDGGGTDDVLSLWSYTAIIGS